jgi:hypothetical protein
MRVEAERLTEVLRLCTVLADRALDAQIMGRQIPPEQVAALTKASRLLQDHGVGWPPLLTQVLHELALEAEASKPDPELSNALSNAVKDGLSRFFARPRIGSEER